MAGFNQKPFSADILFKNGQVFEEGNTKIKVLHTPGHTAGSVCYFFEDIIFTGDTLFEGTIGRTDFPTGDFAVINKSLKLLKDLTEDYKIYSGHGLSTTLSREKLTNPYLI